MLTKQICSKIKYKKTNSSAFDITKFIKKCFQFFSQKLESCWLCRCQLEQCSSPNYGSSNVVLLRFQKFCCQSVSVGFCKKNRGFRFGFCLSLFPPVVNVVRLCRPQHIKPAAVRYIFLCITPVDSRSIQQSVTGGVKTTTCTQCR